MNEGINIITIPKTYVLSVLGLDSGDPSGASSGKGLYALSCPNINTLNYSVLVTVHDNLGKGPLKKWHFIHKKKV